MQVIFKIIPYSVVIFLTTVKLKISFSLELDPLASLENILYFYNYLNVYYNIETL